MQKIVTKKFKETVRQGEKLAKSLKGGEIVCLEGDLGAGKTTFAQGILKGLNMSGNYTSPTFIIMKKYQKKDSCFTKNKIKNVYHIDTYRVEAGDILEIGWKEIIASNKNIIIVEWPEKIKEIIPEKVIWIKFESIDENTRKILIK